MSEQLELFDSTQYDVSFFKNEPRVIGICGRLHSGKDTVCKLMQELRPDLTVRRAAFAERLKLSAARSIGIHGPDDEVLSDIDQFKEHGQMVLVLGDKVVGNITGRQYLQFAGTEGGRYIFGDSFWTDLVLDSNRPPYWGHDKFDVLVVTDVRFDDEAQKILDLGGEVWRVVRSTDEGEDSHASEAGISDQFVSLIIYNDGTLEQLKEKVRKIVCP